MTKDLPYTLGERLIAFWSKVDELENGCWPFNGSRNSEGYGNFWDNGICKKAHRFAWECFFGEIPIGMLVRHKCDNPPCCNPDHLELGTNADNTQDKVSRGRMSPTHGAHNPSAYLTEDLVRQIYAYLRYTEVRDKDVAILFNISPGHLSNIKRGWCWPHLWQEAANAAFID